jgi:hypothetical protein
VEAQQCVKLTSTNRPFGLIIKLSQTVFEKACNRVLQPSKRGLHAFVNTVRSTQSRTCNASA